MKKYLLFISVIFALPALYSCGGPTGDPKKDAEAFEEITKKLCEFDLKFKTREADYIEYYAEHADYKNLELYDDLKGDLDKEFEDYRKRISDLNYKIKDMEDDLQLEEDDLMNMNVEALPIEDNDITEGYNP